MTPNYSDKPLENKQILLLMPSFYELQNKIKAGLEALGAEVVVCESFIFLQDKWVNSNKLDRYLRILKDPFYRQRHTTKILKEIEPYNIDILLTVFSYSASPELISYLKRENPNFKSYIYFWNAFSHGILVIKWIILIINIRLIRRIVKIIVLKILNICLYFGQKIK